MQTRKLGSTGLTVSTVTMGCWGVVGGAMWGAQEEADSIATIHAALDAGITCFDTAEGYGDGYSEELLGKALGGRRAEVVIASKAGSRHMAGADVIQACEDSLRRLGTDVIDLYQIHWPSRTVPFAETVEALHKLQTQGKIRAVGLSNFGTGDLADILPLGDFAANQLPYSLLWRAVEFDVVAQCQAAGMGILCYSPLLHGLLADKFATAAEVPDGRARTRHFSPERSQVRHEGPGHEAATFASIDRIREIAAGEGVPMAQLALAWLLHQPGVTSVISGARKPAHIIGAAQAADLTLSPATLAALDAATADLKAALGPDPDMWMTTSRFR